jgi:ABC-2 type transport system permease protein
MTIKRYFYMYFRFYTTNIKAMLEYKSDFYIMLFAGVLTQALGFIFLWALYQRIPDIMGWTMWEIAFMYAVIFVTEGVVSLFFEGTWNMPFLVNEGEYDRFLLRPVSPIMQIFSSAMGAQGISNLLLGGFIIAQSLSRIDMEWTAAKAAMALILLISAIVIRVSVNLAVASTSFWMKNGSTPMMALLGLTEFAKYPVTIFWWGIKVLVIFVIPYAFISFFPATYLFDKQEWGMLGLISPLVAVYCAAVSYFIFRMGLRRYESVGN